MLTRKDFALVASAIHEAGKYLDHSTPEFADGVTVTREYLARVIANHFEANNPGFDRDRFLKACGVMRLG